MKSDYVSLWYTQFRKLRASKGGDLLLCNDTEFDLHLVILNTLHWQLPFHSTLVTRCPYLGHDNWRQRYRYFSHYKVPLTFRYSWKRLRKSRSKNLIKFPQVYIAFVLQYVHSFEKNNTYWLNKSWETRLPKRVKCTIVVISAYVDASRKFALIGNFWDTVDRGRKRAYVACVLIKLVPVNRQLIVEVEHARLSATVGN